MDAPVALEVDQQSVLLGWRPVHGALAYELQMACSDDGDGDVDASRDKIDWNVLSSSIQGCNIRKKNLTQGMLYFFRVRSKLSTGWDDFSVPSGSVMALPSSVKQIAAPTLLSKDTTSITIMWDAFEDPGLEIEGYRLRYRSEYSLEWTYVDTILKNTQVKKKSLEPGLNYYFSVMPVIQNSAVFSEQRTVFRGDISSKQLLAVEYSPQSQPFQVTQFSQYLANLFPTQLLAQDGKKVDTAARLAGKVVAVYFSAHWCGPCRQFTPLLSNVYQTMKSAGKTDKFEVVFCSADHSEEEFKSYFSSMAPWLAIDFEDDERESFMGTFKVQGIPKLVILSPDGRTLADNAVNPSLGVGAVEQWIKLCNL